MANPAPSYENLFAILNDRIAKLVEKGETDNARKEIDVLERLVKLKKAFAEFAEKAKSSLHTKPTKDTKSEKEKLFKELEERLTRIREANQECNNLR